MRARSFGSVCGLIAAALLVFPSTANAQPGGTESEGFAGEGDNTVTAEDWDKLAQCESNGDWSINTGNGYYGGLQFSGQTWTAFGGGDYAPTADKASKEEQMEVANKILKEQGWNAWPACTQGSVNEVTSKKPAPPGTFVSGSGGGGGSSSGRSKPPSERTASDGGGPGAACKLEPLPENIGSEEHLRTNAVRGARVMHQKFPELRKIGGYRPNDSGEHGKGDANDLMTNLSGRKSNDEERALGERMKKFLLDNAEELNVMYVIWENTLTFPNGETQQQNHQDPTKGHYDHVHVSYEESEPFRGGDLPPFGGACDADSGGGDSGAGQGSSGLAYPTDKDAVQLTSGFGSRWGTNHNGLDLAGPEGTPLYAYADGKVVHAADTGVRGFGGWVVIEHQIDGETIQTVYGHINPGNVLVKEGDQVKAGDHIANMGNAGQSTGPHLHFEVIRGNRDAGGTPVDPKPWLDRIDQGGAAVPGRPGQPAGGGSNGDGGSSDAGGDSSGGGGTGSTDGGNSNGEQKADGVTLKPGRGEVPDSDEAIDNIHEKAREAKGQ